MTDWTIEQIRAVVTNRSFIVIGGDVDEVCDYLDQPEHGDDLQGDPPAGVVVDVQSAHALVTVYDAVSPANQAKLAAMPISAAVAIATKLLTPKSPTV